jgi:hypothetical protein
MIGGINLLDRGKRTRRLQERNYTETTMRGVPVRRPRRAFTPLLESSHKSPVTRAQSNPLLLRFENTRMRYAAQNPKNRLPVSNGGFYGNAATECSARKEGQCRQTACCTPSAVFVTDKAAIIRPLSNMRVWILCIPRFLKRFLRDEIQRVLQRERKSTAAVPNDFIAI